MHSGPQQNFAYTFVLTDAIQKRKNLVIKRKTKAFNSAKYYIIKTQAVGS